jgi:hypothetical protein
MHNQLRDAIMDLVYLGWPDDMIVQHVDLLQAQSAGVQRILLEWARDKAGGESPRPIASPAIYLFSMA